MATDAAPSTGARRVVGPGWSNKSPMYTKSEDRLKFSDVHGPFAAQQYLQHLLAGGTDVPVSTLTPVPDGCDPAVWQYEQIRQFVVDLNQLTVRLGGACTATTCPLMNATDEWQYLCAAHKTPRECCAIDYIVHTLDGTSALLCLEKAFPSRVRIPVESLHYFQSIMRRLYRILSHAFFHHRALFAEFESKHRLCRRFVHFSRHFRLIGRDQLIIPDDAY